MAAALYVIYVSIHDAGAVENKSEEEHRGSEGRRQDYRNHGGLTGLGGTSSFLRGNVWFDGGAAMNPYILPPALYSDNIRTEALQCCGVRTVDCPQIPRDPSEVAVGYINTAPAPQHWSRAVLLQLADEDGHSR